MTDTPELSPQDSARYQSLFEGSAQLGLMLGALEIPWIQVVPFVAAFPESLSRYMELSVDDRGRSLGLMTRGEGKPFCFAVTRFMEERGIGEYALRRFLVVARAMEHRNCFFKIEADQRGIQEFSWYFRRRPELTVGRAFLAAQGIGPGDLDKVEQVAEALGKSSIHFIAGSEGVDGRSQQKLYFSQPDSAESWERLRRAAALLGVDEPTWAQLDRHFGALGARTSFLSMGFTDGLLDPGCKVDIADVPRVTLREILQESGAEEAEGRFAILLDSTSSEAADYAGFRLRSGQPLSTRVYTTRQR